MYGSLQTASASPLGKRLTSTTKAQSLLLRFICFMALPVSSCICGDIRIPARPASTRLPVFVFFSSSSYATTRKVKKNSSTTPTRPPATPASVAGRCDPSRPNSPHPTDCYIFYQCVDRLNGIEQVEKTCNPPNMYSPDTNGLWLAGISVTHSTRVRICSCNQTATNSLRRLRGWLDRLVLRFFCGRQHGKL